MSSNSTTASRESAKVALARHKALHTVVYISGLTGVHTLETGLAYYYRGHYLYSYPVGNLIEPIPYSTRKGIMIQGVHDANAPKYDANASGLAREEELNALRHSIEAESVKPLTPSTLATTNTTTTDTSLKSSTPTPSPSLRLTPPADALHHALTSLSALRDTNLATSTPRHGLSFLAASAPGSRLASRSASPADLRPSSSHVGLARLSAIHGPISPSCADSEANSTPEHIPACEAPAVGYLFGLGDHALSGGDLPWRREGTVGRCAVHGEGCDGVGTEGGWLTERVRRGKGFVERVPVVECGGREMVDWSGLVEEVRGERE